MIIDGHAHACGDFLTSEGRVLQYLWITQQESDPIKYLSSKFSEWKFKGVKMHQCWEWFSVNSSYFINIAGWAEKNDLPLFIHLYSNKDVDEIIKYKKKHPGLKLIIAHIFRRKGFNIRRKPVSLTEIMKEK